MMYKSNAYRGLVERSEGKRAMGREDNIKINLRGIG
jgi:hypothetical protein